MLGISQLSMKIMQKNVLQFPAIVKQMSTVMKNCRGFSLPSLILLQIDFSMTNLGPWNNGDQFRKTNTETLVFSFALFHRIDSSIIQPHYSLRIIFLDLHFLKANWLQFCSAKSPST